jgi:hypothetical protein
MPQSPLVYTAEQAKKYWLIEVVDPITNPPVNTAAPVASGIGTVGQILTCTTGTWNNSPSSYAYRWQRNGTDIVLNGAASTYTLVAADSGTNVGCNVTATNAIGNASAVSNAIAVT